MRAFLVSAQACLDEMREYGNGKMSQSGVVVVVVFAAIASYVGFEEEARRMCATGSRGTGFLRFGLDVGRRPGRVVKRRERGGIWARPGGVFLHRQTGGAWNHFCFLTFPPGRGGLWYASFLLDSSK